MFDEAARYTYTDLLVNSYEENIFMIKTHLGNGVYAEIRGVELILSTKDKNDIALTDSTITALNNYLQSANDLADRVCAAYNADTVRTV